MTERTLLDNLARAATRTWLAVGTVGLGYVLALHAVYPRIGVVR